MPSLARFIVAHTEARARAHARRNELVSGVVVRRDGASVLVNVGDRTMGAQPILGQPLLVGDRVWLQIGFGQPKIIGLQGRSDEFNE